MVSWLVCLSIWVAGGSLCQLSSSSLPKLMGRTMFRENLTRTTQRGDVAPALSTSLKAMALNFVNNTQ